MNTDVTNLKRHPTCVSSEFFQWCTMCKKDAESIDHLFLPLPFLPWAYVLDSLESLVPCGSFLGVLFYVWVRHSCHGCEQKFLTSSLSDFLPLFWAIRLEKVYLSYAVLGQSTYIAFFWTSYLMEFEKIHFLLFHNDCIVVC